MSLAKVEAEVPVRDPESYQDRLGKIFSGATASSDPSSYSEQRFFRLVELLNPEAIGEACTGAQRDQVCESLGNELEELRKAVVQYCWRNQKLFTRHEDAQHDGNRASPASEFRSLCHTLANLRDIEELLPQIQSSGDPSLITQLRESVKALRPDLEWLEQRRSLFCCDGRGPRAQAG